MCNWLVFEIKKNQKNFWQAAFMYHSLFAENCCISQISHCSKFCLKNSNLEWEIITTSTITWRVILREESKIKYVICGVKHKPSWTARRLSNESKPHHTLRFGLWSTFKCLVSLLVFGIGNGTYFRCVLFVSFYCHFILFGSVIESLKFEIPFSCSCYWLID